MPSGCDQDGSHSTGAFYREVSPPGGSPHNTPGRSKIFTGGYSQAPAGPMTDQIRSSIWRSYPGSVRGNLTHVIRYLTHVTTGSCTTLSVLGVSITGPDPRSGSALPFATGINRPLCDRLGWKQTRLTLLQHPGLDVFCDGPECALFCVISGDADMTENALARLSIDVDRFDDLNEVPRRVRRGFGRRFGLDGQGTSIGSRVHSSTQNMSLGTTRSRLRKSVKKIIYSKI